MKKLRLMRCCRLLTWLAILAWLTGCSIFGSSFPQKHVESRAEVGSHHLALLSVMPWEKYKDLLQPHFELDETKALDMAMPSTLGTQDFATAATIIKGSFKPTGSTSEEQTTPDSKAAAQKESDAQRTALASFAAKENPFLKYLAATALYQEVNILNAYIEEAANIAKEYEPYVVRLQINLMPRARHMPYDAYIALSFLPKYRSDNSPNGYKPEGIKVVPMLVSESLEMTESFRAEQKLLQLVLALNAEYPGVGLSGGPSIDTLMQRVRAAAGKDVNSIFSLARVWDSTVLARFGAMQMGSEEYVMVPRTHCVTLLVLVPKINFPCKSSDVEVEVYSRVEFVDAKTGIAVPRGGSNIANQQFLSPLRMPSISSSGDAPTASLLEANLQDNHYGNFTELAEKVIKQRTAGSTEVNIVNNQSQANYQELIKQYFPQISRTWWVDMAMNQLEYNHHAVSVTFHKPSFGAKPKEKQTVLLRDDGRAITTAIYGEDMWLWRKNLEHNIWLTVQSGTSIRELHPAKIQSVRPGNNIIKLEFPSLTAHGLAPKEGVHSCTLRYERGKTLQAHYYNASAEDKLEKIYLKPLTTTLKAEKKSAKLSVFVAPLMVLPEAAYLRIDGAELDVKNSNLGQVLISDPTGKLWKIGKPGQVELALTNLEKGRSVVLSAWTGTTMAALPAFISVEEAAATTPAAPAKN